MNRILLRVAVLLTVASLIGASKSSRAEGACDAAEYWERMLSAKGGRSRLEQVNTFYFTQTYRWRSGLRIRSLQYRSLYIGPSFYWGWLANDDSRFGTNVTTFDYSKGVGLTHNSESAGIRREPVRKHPIGELLLYLPENKSERPEPIRCEVDNGGTIRLWVRTQVSPPTIIYTLDPITLLPSHAREIDGALAIDHYFSEYADFEGIKLPRSHKRTDTLRALAGRIFPFRMEFEVNPVTNAEVQSREPCAFFGPNVWRASYKWRSNNVCSVFVDQR